MKTFNFIKQHSLTSYFFLAFIISWGLIIIIAGPGNIPINSEKSQALLPLLYVSMLFGPSIAGLLMIGLSDGKSGFRKLKTSLFKWKVSIWWYIFALFATPLLAFLILFVLSTLNPQYQVGFINSENITTVVINGIIAGIMVGIFEEIGWTGFVIPRLSSRYNIVATGTIVGAIWGLWHFILFWENDSFFELMPFMILLARLFAWLPPFRIMMVWIYTKTKSLLLTILTHASLVFTTTVIVPMTLKGEELLTWIITWGVALWILTAVIIIAKPRAAKDIQGLS